MTTPQPHEIISVHGPEGESVFHRFREWALPEAAHSELQAQVDALLAHVGGLKDDRLLVLLGCMVVENALDLLLHSIMPGYAALEKDTDFTLSMRIKLGRSLKLIPGRILSAADAIRQMRNDFAHELSVKSFADLRADRLATMRRNLQEYGDHFLAGRTDAQVFELLVGFTTIALLGYTEHLKKLSKYLRSSEFMAALEAFSAGPNT